ncbi:MAG: aldehyde dehydrogenase [Bacteroidota bacterium]|nr:aldehyde dehydrogenase [Bacteroidota bacterium]
MKLIKNYIGGEWFDGINGAWLDNINPATGDLIGKIPYSAESDIAKAVEASKSAFIMWAKTTAQERCNIMLKIADGIDQNLEELALAETEDTGKPLYISKSLDIPRAAANFRFFATAAVQFSSESHDMPGLAINYTLRQPIGIVGCISPWNLPLYLFTWKIAPVLAAGNCVIAKPSEMSPTTAFLLSKICHNAGLPAGVLNILHGLGSTCGEAIIRHPDIKAISFTGGTQTGARIASIAGPMFKKLSLELGGKNPCLVFDDCDYEATLAEVIRLAFSNQGQICLCGSRILIHKSMYDVFRDDLVDRANKLKVGDPLLHDTRIGAVVSASHRDKILSYIDLAREEGGHILCGGASYSPTGRCEKGFFITPTIIEGLGPECRTNTEEIFGPVITLQSFETEEEAVTLANASSYGLASSLWTADLSRAHRISPKLNTGIVWVNCWLLRDLRTPFGGMNDSGVGREGGLEAMRFFTEAKNICVKYS